MFKNIKNLKAFTVLETLFAVLIFSMSLASLMAVSGEGIIAVTSAREEMIASYLNQEAVEAVRWYRDNQKLTTTSPVFTNLFPPSCVTSSACSVNIDPPNAPIFAPCGSPSAGTCAPIYESSGVYSTTPLSGGAVTVFKRGLVISVNTTNNTARVTSRVVWNSKGINRTNELQVTLTEW